tara:strand:- start:34150 stop:34863 length:714 start_codon:yes stop_codon:yes gene_type:complete
MTINEYVTSKVGFPVSVSTEGILQGIIEVIAGVMKLNPAAGLLFAHESDEQDTNGFKVDSGIIFTVMREDGTDNQWRACKEIDKSKEYLVTDVNSFSYASKYNPAFIRDKDNQIYVYPVPSSSNETYKLNYIEYPTLDFDGVSLSPSTDLDSTGIRNFPKQFYPHLILNLSIKGITFHINNMLSADEDVELVESYKKIIETMNSEYAQMFLTKELLMNRSDDSDEDRPRRRRRRRRR